MKAPLPPEEEERRKALRRYAVLDPAPEREFDDISRLASHICGTPAAAISLLDENGQWFKSKIGLTGSETSRDLAFCAHGISQAGVFVVNDAQGDKRFAAIPPVTGHPEIRFYAGAPLLTSDGHALGMLSVTDQVPRELSAEQKTALQALSRQVVAQLESRRSLKELRETVAQLTHAKQELNWKTAFLEAQANSSIDGIVVVDRLGRKTLQNQRTADLFKIPRIITDGNDEAAQVRWVTNMTKNPKQFTERVAYLYSHPNEISREEIELKDGTILDRYSSPVVGEDGKCYGRIWTFRDITERKRGEEALRESEERFSGAFEHAPIGVALVAPDGRWLKVNRALCDLVGYSEAELLAHTFQDITHPEDLEVDLENVRRMITGEIRSYQMEKRYVHGRGHLVTVWLSVSLVRDGQGQPRYFIAQIQDITERKQTENALRESNEKFHQLTNHITDVFWIRSPDMREVHYISPAFERIWGRSVESLYANPQQWADFILPEDRERVLGVFAGLTGDAPSLDIEYRIVRPDGELRWVRVRGFQVRDAAGKLIRHTGIVTDITERRRAEAELEQTHRELLETSRQAGMAEVATEVLHNVGNVLNSVNVASSCVAESIRKSKAINLSKVVVLLREHEADLGAFLTDNSKGKQIPGYLAQLAEHLATEQAGALKELAGLQKNIGHIKDIVTMQQGFAKVSGTTETLSVTELVEDALKMNASALARHDIAVTKEFQKVPLIRVEKHKVLQILVNLVRNAQQACDESDPPEKRLNLRVTHGDDRVRIAVTDNGIGILSENLTRIFAHGFTTKQSGHGFGLHSGALAAKEMGGSLTVHSDGLDLGSTFTLELPLNP
jgi:PAS domain S-box-containing protein